MDWRDISGWLEWRSAQEEAARQFPDGSRFVEVGNFLGRSLCSPGEGGGTFAGALHKNLIECGYSELISLIVADSVTASTF